MTKEQSDRLDAIYQQKMAGTPAAAWWRDEMSWDDIEEEVEQPAEQDNCLSLSQRLQVRLSMVAEEAEADSGVEEDISRGRTYSFSNSSPACTALAIYHQLDRRSSMGSFPESATSSGYASRASSSGTNSPYASRNSLAPVAITAHPLKC